uniref:Ribosomal protein n=1 Tax=Nephromyces sp. ex Molgula occidentalis TaxID=2544991 RepID=A0A5C1H9M3_9APIC|nr:50S ribosomal protein L36 [Nephromyces sp. ex Molgula occidentalis]
MKIRTSLKRFCSKCKIIKRKKQLVVICDIKKHKQHQKWK